MYWSYHPSTRRMVRLHALPQPADARSVCGLFSVEWIDRFDGRNPAIWLRRCAKCMGTLGLTKVTCETE